MREAFERARFSSTLSMKIDDCVSKQTIKPRNRSVFVADARNIFRSFHERSLQNVFGEGRVSNASFDERQEAPVIFHERLHDLALAILAKHISVGRFDGAHGDTLGATVRV